MPITRLAVTLLAVTVALLAIRAVSIRTILGARLVNSGNGTPLHSGPIVDVVAIPQELIDDLSHWVPLLRITVTRIGGRRIRRLGVRIWILRCRGLGNCDRYRTGDEGDHEFHGISFNLRQRTPGSSGVQRLTFDKAA